MAARLPVNHQEPFLVGISFLRVHRCDHGGVVQMGWTKSPYPFTLGGSNHNRVINLIMTMRIWPSPTCGIHTRRIKKKLPSTDISTLLLKCPQTMRWRDCSLTIFQLITIFHQGNNEQDYHEELYDEQYSTCFRESGIRNMNSPFPIMPAGRLPHQSL